MTVVGAIVAYLGMGLLLYVFGFSGTRYFKELPVALVLLMGLVTMVLWLPLALVELCNDMRCNGDHLTDYWDDLDDK